MGLLPLKKLGRVVFLPNQFAKYSSEPFVHGSANLKHSSLVDHSKSKGYKIAQKEVSRKPGESAAETIIEKLNDATYQKLDKLFRNAHGIALHSRPLSDFVWMCELDEKKGVDIGITYRTDKECHSFIHSIAQVERRKKEKLIRNAKFICILSDGSTDASVREQEIVYIRCCIQGAIHILFAGLVEVGKADAAGIFQALKCGISLLCQTEKEKEILD